MATVDITQQPIVVEAQNDTSVVSFTENQVTVEVPSPAPVVEFGASATLVAGTGLVGGGYMLGSVVIGLSPATIASLLKADTALQPGIPVSAFTNDVGYLTAATVGAGFQPLADDLTYIANLTTTVFGRSFLELADAVAARTLIGVYSTSDTFTKTEVNALIAGRAAASHTHGNIDITSLAWSKLTDIPATFPPGAHTHLMADITDLNFTVDHGGLTGLADDDHTQYHTDARGDARYSLLGHTHDYAASAHTHNVLYSNSGNGTEHNAFHAWNAENRSDVNPGTGWYYAWRLGHGDPINYYNVTFAVSFFSDDVYFRRKAGGVDQTWRTLWHSGNLSPWDMTFDPSMTLRFPAGGRVVATNTSAAVDSNNNWGFTVNEGGVHMGDFMCVRDGTAHQVWLRSLSGSLNLSASSVINLQGAVNVGWQGTTSGAPLDVRASATSEIAWFQRTGAAGARIMFLDSGWSAGIGTVNGALKLYAGGSTERGTVGTGGDWMLGPMTGIADNANGYAVEIRGDDGGANTELTLRFHQSNRWWNSIRVRNTGFYFTGGYDGTLANIYASGIALGDQTGYPYLYKSSNGYSVRISTTQGFMDLGPQNSSFCHIVSDGKPFYFNTTIHTNGPIYDYASGYAYLKQYDTILGGRFAFNTETFTHDGDALAHYGMSWFNNSGTGGMRVTLAGYDGLEFFTQGARRTFIDTGGNIFLLSGSVCVQTGGAFYLDGGSSFRLQYSGGTYGSFDAHGGKNGYGGVRFASANAAPYLMFGTGSLHGGIYSESHGWFLIMNSAGKWSQTTSQYLIPMVTWASYSGGSATMSRGTAAPSGGSDGDIYFQYT